MATLRLAPFSASNAVDADADAWCNTGVGTKAVAVLATSAPSRTKLVVFMVLRDLLFIIYCC